MSFQEDVINGRANKLLGRMDAYATACLRMLKNRYAQIYFRNGHDADLPRFTRWG